jgi:hypothetical protein
VTDPVPDDVWAEATSHFNTQEPAAILLSVDTVDTVNLWNNLHVAIRQQADPDN